MTSTAPTTTGTTSDPRVRAALDRAVELGEKGVQVSAYVGDRLIVDEWTGEISESGAPVSGDTLFNVFSVSKGVVATAIHLQAERGLLDLDAPIATYWPEYAANGKEGITVRHVLMHRAGVPQMPVDLTVDRLSDWHWIVGKLAEVEPLCPPGTRSQYHSISFGYLLAEVVRRTDLQQRSYSEFLQDELYGPLGVTDFWFGLPDSEEHRVAPLTWGANPPAAPQVAPNEVRNASMPPSVNVVPDKYNLPEVRRACIPAAGGIANARSVARFYSLLARGGDSLISRDRLVAATELRPNPMEIDEAIGMPTSNGVGGWWVADDDHPSADPVASHGKHVLAHGGAGGSIAWADLDTGLAVAITHNRMFAGLPLDEQPFISLGEAVRAAAADAASAA
jgi:CubicO group peptidase (beta-lactamase class C family)